MTTSAQFAPAGILGAVIFVITAVVQLLRERIVETEALAEQRGSTCATSSSSTTTSSSTCARASSSSTTRIGSG